MSDSNVPTLATHALAGVRRAWDELIQRHHRQVVAAVIRRGCAPEEAEELAQEAWLQLIKQQKRGKLSDLKLPGLAIRQAQFLALDAHRKQNPIRGSVGLDALSRCPDGAQGPERTLLTRETLDRAENVLRTCSPTAQKVFRLVYGNAGLDHRAAAERAGISLQRTRQIICEVRRKLRTSIEEA